MEDLGKGIVLIPFIGETGVVHLLDSRTGELEFPGQRYPREMRSQPFTGFLMMYCLL